jgi:hypothetical protein
MFSSLPSLCCNKSKSRRMMGAKGMPNPGQHKWSILWDLGDGGQEVSGQTVAKSTTAVTFFKHEFVKNRRVR